MPFITRRAIETTLREALYAFWNSFSVPAYEENSVPTGIDSPGFPRITFPMVTSGFGETARIFVSVWTRSDSWAEAVRISDSIETALKNGGKCLLHDSGMVWIVPAEPFARGTGDPNDSEVKRMLLDITLRFN